MPYLCVVKKMALVISFLFLCKPVFPVIEYLANYDYITKELCENRAKPEMQCNGKCHLMKELAKASENEKPLNDKKQAVAEHDQVFFFKSIHAVISDRIFFETDFPQNFYYQNFYSSLTTSSLLRPPVLG